MNGFGGGRDAKSKIKMVWICAEKMYRCSSVEV